MCTTVFEKMFLLLRRIVEQICRGKKRTVAGNVEEQEQHKATPAQMFGFRMLA